MSKLANSSMWGWTYIKGGSKYKYVQKLRDPNGNYHWVFRIMGGTAVECESEREAALRVDKALIGKGKEPVNILVRK